MEIAFLFYQNLLIKSLKAAAKIIKNSSAIFDSCFFFPTGRK
ncbi:hypothetical protein HMPREF0201_02144 [Cedecea davisae DSM 4568]|uniref:Uncharacterized protein n=1 Tax=Cedecea davisae DSM 4568 TaxID=566551 RepID=S3JUT1_9ENTR|nr:hypothetical protein HMPREF0201_02144 [Cedecea davisae DSM 4568]